MLKKYTFAHAALGYALLIRFSLYLTNRALWLDEILLARNIQAKSFSDLLYPLDHSQMAPFGFLSVQKLFMLLFGGSEYIFRLAPFLSSIAAVIIFHAIAKKVMDQNGTFIATLMFAICPSLIRYSAEGKQYMFDVLVLLLGIFIAIKAIEKNWSLKHIILFSLFGSISIWFSHPSVFVIGAIGITGGIFLLQQKRYSQLLLMIFVSLIQAAIFYSSLLPTVNAAYGQSGMSSFFTGLFPPIPITNTAEIKWYLYEPLQFFSNPLGLTFSGLAIVFFTFGVWRLWQKKRLYSMLLLSPFVLAVLAAYLRRYPIHDRLALFLVPIFYLFIAHGLAGIKKHITNNFVYFLLIGLFLFHPLIFSLNPIISPSFFPQTRETLTYLNNHIQPQDGIYVYYKAEPSFDYYGPKKLRSHPVTIGISSRRAWLKYLPDIDKTTEQKRVWFYFSHVARWNGVNEKQLFLNYLDTIGVQKEKVANDGASLYLYDFSEPDIRSSN